MDIRFSSLGIETGINLARMESSSCSVFGYSGFAKLTDLESHEYRSIFQELEKSQEAFLAKFASYRDPKYRWPIDPLHCWSRLWEYPYVLHQIRSRLIDPGAETLSPRILDLGSGVTFFPFCLASLGLDVWCCDPDEICQLDLHKAIQLFDRSQTGRVDFKLLVDKTLPFSDDYFDAVYCISVLEHIPDFENTVLEIQRVLRPGGSCIITCDISLDSGNTVPLSARDLDKLTRIISKYFDLDQPLALTHPKSLLTTRSSPQSPPATPLRIFLLEILKQRILKPLLGRKPAPVYKEPFPLAVLALTLTKKPHG
jgi:SAM-dependent methyltransferase